jgi:hypothetical protein
MYEYTLDILRDADFFSAPRYDAVSNALLKSGDTICICDRCGKIHLQSSWEANDKRCAGCEGKKRKNITEEYLHGYRVMPSHITGRGRQNVTAGSGHRRTAPMAASGYRPAQAPIQGIRRPVNRGTDGNTAPASAALTNVGVDHARLLRDSRKRVPSQVYPPRRAARKRAGRILLGLVCGLIAAAVIIALSVL